MAPPTLLRSPLNTYIGGVVSAERSPSSPTASTDTQLPGTRERFLHLDSGVAYSSNSFVFNGLFGVVDGTDGEFVMNYFEKIWTKGHVLTGKDFAWPPIAPGFLDLFSGSKGVASWLLRFTDSWVVTYELEDGPDQDLDSEECQKELMRLLALGVFQSWGGGPVCRSFSRAVTPAVRTREHPLGLEDMRISMREKVQQGNKSADWVCSLMEVSLLLGIFFWVENPDGSFMFLLPRWASLVEEWMGELGSWRLDYCRFGAAWRKRTKILTNSCLKPHSTLCSRDHQHIPLRGRSAFHRKSWTLLAQAYPKLVAKTIAGGIATSCGYLEEQKGGFDPSTFAFCQWRRIGEAKNPGPRPARTLELDEVRLIEAKTAQLQGKIWKWFLTWAGESLTPEALESLTRDPMTLSVLIKEFGCHLFKEGKSFYILRHLVVLVSKQVLGMKPFLGPCWEIINKWEEIEPPRHRTPLPIAVLHAMVTVALHWEWNRFAGAILISFYGITRPGEVLRATRSDLSLPSDRLASGGAPGFLRIRTPKSRHRGGARVQHATILDEGVVAFLEVLFKHSQRRALLYPISPSSFRRRWDKVLEFLGIMKSEKLSPGSLRAGGAIEEYRRGTDLTRLLWRMRLRHLITLEHYVQELAVDSFIADLEPNTRRKVFLFAELFHPTLSVVAAQRDRRDGMC